MFPVKTFQGEEHRPFFMKGGRGAALLVHGFPGTPAEMRPLAEQLHAVGWTVQGILLPGFGSEVEHMADKRYGDWLGAVEKALATLKQSYDPVLLVGYSLGGALSLRAAVDNPPDGLVLLAPFWRINHVLWTMLPALKHLLRGVKPFKLIKLKFDDPETRKGIANFMPDADLDDPTVQMAIRDFKIPLDLFAQLQQAGKLAYQAAPRLATSTPTLVIQGRIDDLVRPELTQQMIKRIPGTVGYVEVESKHDLVVQGNPIWPEVVQFVLDFAGAIS